MNDIARKAAKHALANLGITPTKNSTAIVTDIIQSAIEEARKHLEIEYRTRLRDSWRVQQQSADAKLLAKAMSLLRDITAAHRYDDDADYNECDKNPCQFCIEVSAIDAAMKEVK